MGKNSRGWGNMTTKERSAEMKRRRQVAKRNKEASATQVHRAEGMDTIKVVNPYSGETKQEREQRESYELGTIPNELEQELVDYLRGYRAGFIDGIKRVI